MTESFSLEQQREYLARRRILQHDVYISSFQDQTLVLKRLPDYDAREYQVGVALNTLAHPNIVRTLDRWRDEYGNAWLVLEYVSTGGLIPLPATTRAQVALDVTYILEDINSQRQFCTYDCHPSNYLVEPLREEREFRYKVGGEWLTVSRGYRIVLIDFEFAYLEGVTPPREYLSFKMLQLGAVPWRYDPYYDYFTLVSYIYEENDDDSDDAVTLEQLRAIYERFHFHLSDETRGGRLYYYCGRPCYNDWRQLRQYNESLRGEVVLPKKLVSTKVTVERLVEELRCADEIDDICRVRKMLCQLADAYKRAELLRRPSEDPRPILRAYISAQITT